MRSAAVLPGLLNQGNAQHDDQREEAGGYSPGVESQGPCRDRAAQCSLVLARKVRLFAGKLICHPRTGPHGPCVQGSLASFGMPSTPLMQTLGFP